MKKPELVITMSARIDKNTIVLFNPIPVKHPVVIQNKRTTSLQVPLVNVPLSLLALARMVKDSFNVRDGINVSAAVKEHYPALPIIWGGYHPSTEPIQTLKNPYIPTL